MKRKRLKSRRIGRIRKEGRLWRERVVLTYAGLMTSSHTFSLCWSPFRWRHNRALRIILSSSEKGPTTNTYIKAAIGMRTPNMFTTALLVLRLSSSSTLPLTFFRNFSSIISLLRYPTRHDSSLEST